MSEERRKAFLVELRRTGGNFTAAAKAASPHSKATPRSKPGFTSFRYAIANDPDFAAEVQEVLTQVRDDVYAVIWRLATEGSQDFVYQKSEQVKNLDGTLATVQKWDTKLLLRLAAKLDPSWNESKNVQHSTAQASAGSALIEPADLRLLSAAQRESLRDILGTIRDAHGAQKALTHQPGEIVDTTFEEVAEPVEVVEDEFPY